MSQNYQIEQKVLEQAVKLAQLEQKNKQAAREQLLRMQLILARMYPQK